MLTFVVEYVFVKAVHWIISQLLKFTNALPFLKSTFAVERVVVNAVH